LTRTRYTPSAPSPYTTLFRSAIRDGIVENLGENVTTSIALLDDPGHGLSEEVLARTDVLTWWGHTAHDEVSDEVAERVQRHVLADRKSTRLNSSHVKISYAVF